MEMQDVYPEIAAGGYPHAHLRAAMFARIRTLLPANAAVLDFGAGRGKFARQDPPALRALTNLKPDVARLAAFDVDTAVLENLETDDRHYAPIGERLPFPDASFDLVYSTWVIEHVADPKFYAAEIARILKPGGWFCALTPNKYGAIAFFGRLVPNRWHVRALKVLAPSRQAEDTFPTCYRMNSIGDIGRLFPGWVNASHYLNGPPAYHANSRLLLNGWRLLDRLLPRTFARCLMVFVRKPGAD